MENKTLTAVEWLIEEIDGTNLKRRIKKLTIGKKSLTN